MNVADYYYNGAAGKPPTPQHPRESMETESVRSARSERSYRPPNDRHSNNLNNHQNNFNAHHQHYAPQQNHRKLLQGGVLRDTQSECGGNRHYNHRKRGVNDGGHRPSGNDTDRDDRSVTIKLPPTHMLRSHMMPSLAGAGGDERIEVQVLPQDDNWGDNTTAITGNTSDAGFSVEDMSRVTKEMERSVGFNCARYSGSALAAFLCLLAFLSPIAMVLMPKLNLIDWPLKTCDPQCEGLFISFALKLTVLSFCTWVLFVRKPRATLPRVRLYRAAVLFLMFVVTFAFWLFYGKRYIETRSNDYLGIVQFASSLVDSLLVLMILAIVVHELSHQRHQFVVRVTRSPDGETQNYSVGSMSVQQLALTVLDNYYRDFNNYNPYLEAAASRRAAQASKHNSFKVYNVDENAGPGNNINISLPGRLPPSRRRDYSHSDRYYDGLKNEEKIGKRKARLISAAEEAFTHIKRMRNEPATPAIPMDPTEAAQSIFPSMARALQKYLRVTRQQPRYTMESILQHLGLSLSFDVSPRAFVEPYLTQGQVIWNDKSYQSSQTWSLVCETFLSRTISHGCILQLKQNEVSLLLVVRALPHFNIKEEVIDPKTNKFVLRLQSETSV